jgi:hypothetical protein
MICQLSYKFHRHHNRLIKFVTRNRQGDAVLRKSPMADNALWLTHSGTLATVILPVLISGMVSIFAERFEPD